MITFKNLEITKSVNAINIPKEIELIKTNHVESIKSFFDVHVTFFNSLIASVIKLRVFAIIMFQLFIKQARLDSNQQPAVLETDALPIRATGLTLTFYFFISR